MKALVCFSRLRTEFMTSNNVISADSIGWERRPKEELTNESLLSQLCRLEIMWSASWTWFYGERSKQELFRSVLQSAMVESGLPFYRPYRAGIFLSLCFLTHMQHKWFSSTLFLFILKCIMVSTNHQFYINYQNSLITVLGQMSCQRLFLYSIPTTFW